MSFLTPHYLHFAWLALIPLALYLFRKRARQVPVSTLIFFRSLSREHQESAWLRRIKRWLSLLLTLLIIVASVLALARPTHQADADAPGAVVLAVDCSASMNARDGQGRTRLDEALNLARQRLLSLPDQTILSLVACADRPRVLLSRSRSRRECLRLLSELSALPVEFRPDSALPLLKRIAALDQRSQLWVASDRPLPAEHDFPQTFFMDVSLPAPTNAGITAFQIRRALLSQDRYEVYVKMEAAETNPQRLTSTLEVTLAGRPVQLREIDLEPGGRASLVIPLEGVHGQLLELRLTTPGDCLGWDDALAAPLPQARPLVVSYLAEKADPFTQVALGAMVQSGRLEILAGEPAAWPPTEKPDVYLFENWLPDQLPNDRPILALNPPVSRGPVQLRRLPEPGLPHDEVRALSPDHPLLFRTTTSRLAITQTGVLGLDSLEPLWMAGNEPVLAAGEVSGQRLVVTAFSPSRSEQLALLPTFPLLLGNALQWCAEATDAINELKIQRTGSLLSTPGLVEWQAWDGSQFITASDSAQHQWLALHRIGAWSTAEAKGASILCSSQETHLPTRPVQATSSPSTAPAMHSSLSDLPRWLLWLTLSLLLLESCLFHRRALY
jgi:hypothetical protein